MTSTTKLAASSMFVLAFIVFGLTCPVHMQAQCSFSEGNTAVYAACGTGINPQGSAAYIDASVFTGTGSKTDVCAKVNAVLLSSTYPAAGAVIDARGILPSSGTTQACSISPWGGTPTSGTWPPATLLLPAGIIAIPAGWVLPNKTRIIGQNAGSTSSGTAGTTTIQACLTTTTGCPTGSDFSGTLITMGSSATVNNCPSTGCIGIGVQDLWLDGEGLSINGIANTFSEEMSFVSHVNLYQIVGTGLGVSGTSTNSGPYSDIGFAIGSATPVADTICAHIVNVSTRGIHGLTCTGYTGTGTIPSNAVIIDASNNTIEDVEVEGFGTAVEIGENDSAQNDAFINIVGSTNVSTVISITKVSGKNVSDISIMAASNGGGSAQTISDARSTPSTSVTAATVAIYVLGDPVDAAGSPIGYTRFTTAVGQPTWVVGAATPSPATGCTVGSTFSNAQGSGSDKTLFVCLPKNKCSPTTATCWTPIG